jgi:hypothetical protein
VSETLERFVASRGRGAVWKAGGGGPLLIVDRTTLGDGAIRSHMAQVVETVYGCPRQSMVGTL